MNRSIEVEEGWNEYEIDMREMIFGNATHPEDEKNFKRWGGEIEQIGGLRIDTWFPIKTTVKFDYIKLSGGK